MAEDREHFSGLDAFLFGTPLWKSKDVTAWQQRAELIRSQDSFQRSLGSKADDIARRVTSSELSQEQGRRDLVDTIKTSIYGFVDEQRRIGSELARNTEITAEGFQAVIQGQEVLGEAIIETAREQTSRVIASQQFQAGARMGGGIERPVSVQHLGIPGEIVAKLIANGSLGPGSPAYQEIVSAADPLTLKLLSGEISSRDVSTIESKARGLQERIIELKASSEKKQIRKIIERHNKAVAGMPASYLKLQEMSETSDPDSARAKMESQLLALQDVLDRRAAANLRKKYARKSTVALVRDGEIPLPIAEALIRHQKLPTTDTDALLEARLVKGSLGSSRRMNIVLEDQRAIQEGQLVIQEQQLASIGSMIVQNDRRDRILASVELGIKGVLTTSLELSKLQADQLVESRRQSGFQKELLAVTQFQTGLEEEHLEISRSHAMATERTNELIEAMADQLVSRLDFSNQALTTLSQQLEGLTGQLVTGVQKICLSVQEGFQALTLEVALTRLAVSQQLKTVTRILGTGFTALDARMSETNEKLQHILTTLRSPRETAIAEACRMSLVFITLQEFSSAIKCLEATQPEIHPIELVHFLLGYCFYKSKDFQAAAHYLGRAKKLAENKPEKNVDIAEQATSLLAHMALQLEELSLSMEALQNLTEKKELAPHLKSTHLELASLQYFSGERESAIDSLINQMLTNPLSLAKILKLPFIKDLNAASDLKKWTAEITEINESNLIYDPECPHLSYFAISIFAKKVLSSQDHAMSSFAAGLKMWKSKLLPLTRDALEEEFKKFRIENIHSVLRSIILSLGRNEDFYWLLKKE